MSKKLFCTHCGVEILPTSNILSPIPEHCVKCARPIKTGKGFCINCGEAIKSTEQVFCLKCGVSFEPSRKEKKNDRSKVVAGILAIMFGGLGVHKFYLGKIGMGIFYILAFLFGLLLFVLPVFIIIIIAFIEGIIYLSMSNDDFDKKYNY